MSVVSDRIRLPATGATHPSRWWPASAHLLLIAVSVLYCAIVFIRTSQSMAFTYDEVVYASQVAVDTEATRFTAPRSRGMTLLLAPVLVFTDSVYATRVYLALLSGVLLYLAFRPWLRVTADLGGRWRYLPPVAAGCFVSLWLVQLYGTMGYPNLWLAFVLVAGVGSFVRAVTEASPAWPAVTAVGGAFAAASLLRPTDAVAAAAPLLVAPLVVRQWRRLRPVLAVVVGLLVGWTAWAVEAYARFGGVPERLREGAEINRGGLVFTVPEHFEALDGPALLCRPHDLCEGVEPSATVWWLVLPVLTVIGLVAARRARWLAAGLLATACALALTGPYFFLIDYAAPRFLLPTYGLLLIPAAGGLLWLLNLPRPGLRPLVAVMVALALLAHVGVQQRLLVDAHDRLLVKSRSVTLQAGQLRAAGVERPCLLWGAGVVPLSYPLKCRSVWEEERAPSETDEELRQALARGEHVVVRLHHEVDVPDFMADWRRLELEDGTYVAYLPR